MLGFGKKLKDIHRQQVNAMTTWSFGFGIVTRPHFSACI